LSVQTGNTPGLVLSTDGVSLPEPLTLKKRLMPLNQPFDLSLTVEIGVSRASLLICEAFGSVEWANGTVRLPDGTPIIGRKSVTVTVRCEADATRCTVTTEDAEQTVFLPFCPTNASDVAIRIPAGEDGFLTVKQFSFHFLPLEADARRV